LYQAANETPPAIRRLLLTVTIRHHYPEKTRASARQ
jgi:hypothetical protein